jgi:L-asparaginase
VQNKSRCVVVLGTGGTIAGRAGSAHDQVGYQSAQLGVDHLLASVSPDAGLAVRSEQVAQIDSKDMDAATWRLLARRVAHHLALPDVQGIVITHGTDTLEETAWLLHRVLAPSKPVVLTAAMRPATSLQADGPQNLADALTVAASESAGGVVAVVAGKVHGAADVRKVHSYRLDAFSSGDAGPVAGVAQGEVQGWRPWPTGVPLGLDTLQADPDLWPWVEIVTSHGGASPRGVRAMVAAGVQGLVVAGTGNGTVHHALAGALDEAVAKGVAVRLVTRCAAGSVRRVPGQRWPSYATLGPPQARVELMLELLVAASRDGITPHGNAVVS